METKVITIYGEVSNITDKTESSREYTAFDITTEEGKTYEVLVRDKDIEYWLEENHRYYARGFEIAEGKVVAFDVDRWGRYCDVCGKWHIEGYWVDEMNYACSEECALTFYGGDKEAFQADLALLDNPETADRAYTYWTEWE
jgi:hypothetical protein